MKKFLVVGEGIWPWYMTAASQALRALDYSVQEVHWADTYKIKLPNDVEPQHRSTWHRLEERAGLGPITFNLNRRLLRAARETEPDFVLFYNVRLIHPSTVRRLRRLLPQAIFGQYANDNPFSDRASWGYWHNFIRSVSRFDVHFAYRLDNVADYRRLGATDVHLLRSYYLPEVDHPIPDDRIREGDRSDVLFAGHYEDDGRLEALTVLAETGLKLKVHGGGWASVLDSLPNGHPLRDQWPAKPVVGDDYRMAIAGTKIALCFLSTMNKDTYTRRNFEVPAIGTAMLSQYSGDLASLFREGEEVEFFRNTQELVAKCTYLLGDESSRKRIARGGLNRVIADGHDIASRMVSLAKAFETHHRVGKS